MSHHGDTSHTPHVASTGHALPYAPRGRSSTLFQVGAGLGIAGFSIGLLIFLVACFGFGAALVLSPLPIVMGAIGFVLSIVGGVRDPHLDGSAVAAAFFICVGAIAGGLLELAAWQGWRVFA